MREEERGGDEWSRVQGKKIKQKWDTRLNTLVGGLGDKLRVVTMFFFTEIPDDCGAKELYMEFVCFSDVDEVIIPPKRDIRGKRSMVS